jgi:aryl-alcohol dehydrogenase-like predicted oxidoreductase
VEYRSLGRSGLKVAPICLGAMQFGWWVAEDESREVLDAYVQAGGNFIDTADVYPILSDGVGGRISEEILGRWLKERGNRHQIVIATKVQGRMGAGANDESLSRKHILDAVEASLRRLQIDYIDVYQAHEDDRTVPLEETIAAFDNLVRRGLVRYVGCSNYAAWRLVEAMETSRRRGYAGYISLQPYYNLIDRADFERELQSVCVARGVGVVPYSPLAKGFLTGKYRRDAPPPNSIRASGVRERYMHERGWRVLSAVDQVARARVGASPAQVALAWLMQRPAVVAPIVGANSAEHLQELLGASELSLDPSAVKLLDEAGAW